MKKITRPEYQAFEVSIAALGLEMRMEVAIERRGEGRKEPGSRIESEGTFAQLIAFQFSSSSTVA